MCGFCWYLFDRIINRAPLKRDSAKFDSSNHITLFCFQSEVQTYGTHKNNFFLLIVRYIDLVEFVLNK